MLSVADPNNSTYPLDSADHIADILNESNMSTEETDLDDIKMTEARSEETAPTTSGSSNKKSVHVKWAGKTIALGTFPPEEADDKCARAKSLTRTWRSTMRPKPSREWVMLELERLQVRQVSGRLGRKAGKDLSSTDVNDCDDDEEKKSEASKLLNSSNLTSSLADLADDSNTSNVDSLIASLRNADNVGLGGTNNTSNSLNTMAEVALLERAHAMFNIGSSSLGGESVSSVSSRPGSSSMLSQRDRGMDNNGGLSSSISNSDLLNLTQGLGIQTSNSVGNALLNCNDPGQHYEMLKLHHMNLLNEIKETTLLMNLFKKHRLQKSVMQNQSGSPLLDILRGTPRPSLQEQLQQVQQQQQQQQQQNLLNLGIGQSGIGVQLENFLRQYSAPPDAPSSNSSPQLQLDKSNKDTSSKLNKIKDEIAALQRQAQELESRSQNNNNSSGSNSSLDDSNSTNDRAWAKRKR